MIKKIFIISILAILFLMPVSNAVYTTDKIPYSKVLKSKILNNRYTNITVHEAYELLITTSNGIQKPIDIRRHDEWKKGRINTPPPEDPELWTDLHFGNNLQEFMDQYAGKEVVIYCRSANRSWTATKLLIENGFTGKIYHMLGGINGWIEAGYPLEPKSKSYQIKFTILYRFFQIFPNAFPILKQIMGL